MKKKMSRPMRGAVEWLEGTGPGGWGPVRTVFRSGFQTRVTELWLEYRYDVLCGVAKRPAASRAMFSRVLKMLGARPRKIPVESCRAQISVSNSIEDKP